MNELHKMQCIGSFNIFCNISADQQSQWRYLDTSLCARDERLQSHAVDRATAFNGCPDLLQIVLNLRNVESERA